MLIRRGAVGAAGIHSPVHVQHFFTGVFLETQQSLTGRAFQTGSTQWARLPNCVGAPQPTERVDRVHRA
eukprot:8289955-Pyramimonas_sp.AAC.1